TPFQHDPDKPWIFRTYAGHSTAEESNKLYRKNLAKGQTGLSIAFDLPTQTAYDSDHVLARGEVGKVGVPVGHLGDMRALFDQIKPEQIAQFKDAFVVLSLSAPGLGQTKPTSVASVEDDGEILATALDDALNQTYLRTLPNAAAYVINLLAIWVLVWMSLKQKTGGFMNKAFVIGQSGLGGITLLSASYTNYLIDLSDSMSFGLSVFAAIKLVQSMDDRWSRARPGFRKARQSTIKGQLMLLGYLDQHVTGSQAKTLQNAAERIVGLANVVRVDDLFGGESFIKAQCAHFKALLVNVTETQAEAMRSLLSQDDYAKVAVDSHDMVNLWDPENKTFTAEVTPLILASAARLLHDDWAETN
ncbi:MAG: hypothetical protein RLZZ239_1827, partial [Pseudomonadota bacterium]